MLAFRLSSHNLATRQPPGSLSIAAGACGIQNTPPGSATLALHARVAALTPSEIEHALLAEKVLLQAWSLRAAPHLFPTRDAGVFTLGLLPVDEASIRFFIRGVEPALDKIGVSATALVSLTAEVLNERLDGRHLTKTELGVELAEDVSRRLNDHQLSAWWSPSWYASGQSLGEATIRFALPIMSLQGLCCHAERRGNQACLAPTCQWLGTPLSRDSRQEASAELVRRYLRCYGPSTVEHFAGWAGIAPAQAAQSWKSVKPDLIEIAFDGRSTWLHQQDMASLTAPPAPRGIRFLPPHDPYLQLRDRSTLIPERALQRRVWQSVGNPGIVLVDGQCVAMWRSHKKGKRMHVAVELIAPVSHGVQTQVEAEAATLAPFRACTSTEVQFVTA